MSFDDYTRQGFKKQPTIDYSAGQSKSLELQNVGYLGNIQVRVTGKLNCKHASKVSFAKDLMSPFNLINRIRLQANGNVDICNVSGYMLYLLNMINEDNYNLDQVVSGSDVFQFGNVVSSGAGTDNDVSFTLNIPVKINDRDTAGLFLLQNKQTTVNVVIDWASPNVVAGSADQDITFAFTGSAYCHVEAFSVPPGEENQPMANFVHQIIEEQITLTGTGENLYNHKRAGYYRRAIMLPVINGAPAQNTDMDRLELWLNDTHNPYSILAPDQRALQRKRYGRDLPRGVYVWDFAHQGLPNLGNHRDYINSRAYTEITSKLFINSGTTMGTNNNVLRVLREQLVPVQKRS